MTRPTARRFRVGLQQAVQHLEIVRVGAVVGGAPHEIGALRGVQHIDEVGHRAPVHRLAHITEPGDAGAERLGDLARGVGGGVVENQHLEVGEGLGAEEFQAPLQPRCLVEHRNANGDGGQALDPPP